MGRKSVSSVGDIEMTGNSRSSGPVVRAFSILKCISEGAYTLSDISQKCSMSYSTTHGLLQKLKQSNAVVYDPLTHRYYLGQMISQLAMNLVFTHQYLIACSVNEMNDLAKYTQVTVTLVVLVGLNAARINMIHGSHLLRLTNAEDKPDAEQFFLSAPGRVLISQLSDENLKKISRFIKPQSTDPQEAIFEEVMTEVRKVQRQGYALSSGTRIQGVSCISVPIRNYSLPAALNVIGPDTVINPRIKQFAPKAVAAAANISEFLKDGKAG